MKLASVRAGAIVLAASLLQSCGGGGGDDNGGSPPPGPNHPPIVAAAISNQQLIVGHAFNFDVSQNGTSFTDPDGDELTYQVTFPLPAPPGLSASGPVISGTPQDDGQFSATIQVFDGRGGDNSAGVLLDISPNSQPVVVNPNPDRVLAAAEFVDLEVTQSGTVFSDADGDPLTYEVRFEAAAHGLSIVGTRVTGTMNSIGLTRVRVIARDGAGGVEEDAFSFALPAPEPGSPTLPSPSFVYDDAQLDLPCQYQQSREFEIPFPDTTPPHNPTTNAGATLGRVLFYDKRLSITNTVACSNCHQQDRGFAAADRFSNGAQGTRQSRNAMSLGNVRYNEFNNFFWDERVSGLENLIPMPIQNSLELAHPIDMVVTKLSATSFYPPLFNVAFGSPEVTSERIAKAVAQFLRAMIAYRSKFDEAFLVQCMGDFPDPSLVFTAQEFRGLQVATESNCFACHDEVVLIVNGGRNNGLDSAFTDPGAGRGRFRPPSLKNIRVTAPYMHDGRFATLRDVISHYDQGVQDSPELDSALRVNSSGPPRRLNLSEEDKDALEVFLDTLTDHEFLADPRFSDPFQ